MELVASRSDRLPVALDRELGLMETGLMETVSMKAAEMTLAAVAMP